ncbi:MAG TPA: hypothetical protein DDX47_05725 [Candidatus Jacksonbacteria bacterium]|nr:hypothetical protein [Candidatus Jacksonbacteria bacterium]HCR15389.1 hypothetical protein [Candidatus Jacksonbacteria bacterium]
MPDKDIIQTCWVLVIYLAPLEVGLILWFLSLLEMKRNGYHPKKRYCVALILIFAIGVPLFLLALFAYGSQTTNSIRY